MSPQDERERGKEREHAMSQVQGLLIVWKNLVFCTVYRPQLLAFVCNRGRDHWWVRDNNPCCYCGEGKAAQSWSYWGRKNRRNKEEIIRSILLLVCLICFRIISEWCTTDFCVLGLDQGMLQARSGSLRPRIKEWCYAEEQCTCIDL